MIRLDKEQLQHMYPEMEETFENRMHSMIHALPSQKEEKTMKKLTLRTALIAALIIAAMMAVALAATSGGLVEWFQSNYGATLPQTAQEILSTTQKSVIDAGPVTFTVSELLCDGKLAYLTTEARLKEEGSAILYPASSDMYDRIGEVMAKKLDHPDVDAKTSYFDAARITGLPLYSVSAWLDIADELREQLDSEMMDGQTTEDGAMLMVRMLYFLKPIEGETLPVTVQVRAHEVDLETQEYKADYDNSLERSIDIHGVTAEKHYFPETPAKLSDVFTLTEVISKQTCAGVYVYIHAKPDEPMTMDEIFEINFEWNVLDEQGEPYPIGVSLSGEFLDGDGQTIAWEEMQNRKLESMQYMLMISADELPESLAVTDYTVKIPVK